MSLNQSAQPVGLLRAILPLAALAIPAIAVAWFLLAGPGQGLYQQALGWLFAEQQRYHADLRQGMSAYADSRTMGAALGIVLVSFLYGVFHAAGPGHGKVILSTYLLTQPERVARSVGLAVASAFVQGLTAIILVYGLFLAFGVAARQSNVAVQWSERLAFALVVLIGVSLLWRGVKALRSHRTAKAPVDVRVPASRDANDHHHVHTHEHAGTHTHDHDAAGVCSSCGHAHAPSGAQVDAASDWRTAAGIVLSIGLRPCSGAILVLVFARVAAIPLAGAAAVAAMSLGTAITVAAIAVLSVRARGLALRLSAVTGGGWTAYVSPVLAVAGGAAIMLLGAGLLEASFDTAPARRSMGL